MYRVVIVRIRNGRDIPVHVVGDYENYEEAENAGRITAEQYSEKYRDYFTYRIKKSVV